MLLSNVFQTRINPFLLSHKSTPEGVARLEQEINIEVHLKDIDHATMP